MQIFYAPGLIGQTYTLDEIESKHCIKVLRMCLGDHLNLIDGNGNLHEGIISNPDASKCKIDIIRTLCDYGKRDYYLHVAISPLKNPERFEIFIEKGVEIGIDEITPIICERSEKKNLRSERIERLIISAMKQSLKAKKPQLNEPLGFEDFLKKEYNCTKMIAHCVESYKRRAIGDLCLKHDKAIIMIGPEGDFTNQEIEMAEKAGFSSVHLGKSRLRTETAGIAACHSVYYINQ